MDELVTKLSPWPADETVERLLAVIAQRPLKLFAVIDHSGAAKTAGLDLRNTKVIIFGAPQAGTPVMEEAPLAALDLPLKVLVWDDHGQTKLSYLAPAALTARYELNAELEERLVGIDLVTDAALEDARDAQSARISEDGET